MCHKRDWSIQRARARLLEVIDRAKLDGPQEIWRNGKKAVVVLSSEDWDRLRVGRSPNPKQDAHVLPLYLHPDGKGRRGDRPAPNSFREHRSPEARQMGNSDYMTTGRLRF